METFNLQSTIHRKWPDPINQSIDHHMFMVKCKDLPSGISLGANVRHASAKTLNKKVSKAVKATLLNQDQDQEQNNMFHRKNSGITILADMVVKKKEDKDSELWMIQYDPENQGILNGGHTYRTIQKAIEQGEDIDSDQYVTLIIQVRVPDDLVVHMAEGLNTSMQVQEKDLANHRKEYDWIKELLKDEPYYPEIAFESTDDGSYDIEFIIQLMFMMNVSSYPNMEDSHPSIAYSSKGTVAKAFTQDAQNNSGRGFKALKPILKDMLFLYETIICGAPGSGGFVDLRPSRLSDISVISGKKPKKFHIIDQEHNDSLHKAFAYPIFASFRWYVIQNGVGLKWRTDFSEVLKAWQTHGGTMLKWSTRYLIDDFGKKFSSFGKSGLVWSGLHKDLATKLSLRS
ncbi:AIPR family protein [Gammaproteobacteria bacterium]|nr:AIPR family protein [Gammaproteobacteria bacterium]